MSDPLSQRKYADTAKVQALAARMPSLLQILGVAGVPPQRVNIRIAIPTAKNNQYPLVRQDYSEAEIILGAKYPFEKPIVVFKTPIWNPNVSASGTLCFGDWTVTENLELFVIRIMKVVALDPEIINSKSPYNAESAKWFVDSLRTRPHLFPTVPKERLVPRADGPSMIWRSVP